MKKTKSAGDMQVIGCPVKMSETPARIEKPAPGLGQHNYQIMKNILNYSDEKIQQIITKITM